MSRDHSPRKQDVDRLYERYVKPLELEHRGKYVGVSFQGGTVIGTTLLEALEQASDSFGKGNTIVFKVGERVVGRLR
jgi:hypothetical protein